MQRAVGDLGALSPQELMDLRELEAAAAVVGSQPRSQSRLVGGQK
jgi:hypothetical protein